MADSAAEPQDRLAELRASAKGWQGIQLAALGFIGLCGVIETGDSTNPWVLQVMSGILVLVAFVLACIGIYLVGHAAWPLYRGDGGGGGEHTVAATSSRLTRGLVMTFLSIAALALATASSWWPKERAGGGGDAAAQVQVQTEDGRSACGTLGDAGQAGSLRLIADGRPIDVALGSLASVTPVGGC